MEVGSQYHAPATLPPGKNLVHVDRGLGGPYIRSGRFRRMENLLPLPGFVSRTVQLVAESLCQMCYPGFYNNNKATWKAYKGRGSIALRILFFRRVVILNVSKQYNLSHVQESNQGHPEFKAEELKRSLST